MWSWFLSPFPFPGRVWPVDASVGVAGEGAVGDAGRAGVTGTAGGCLDMTDRDGGGATGFRLGCAAGFARGVVTVVVAAGLEVRGGSATDRTGAAMRVTACGLTDALVERAGRLVRGSAGRASCTTRGATGGAANGDSPRSGVPTRADDASHQPAAVDVAAASQRIHTLTRVPSAWLART